MVQIVIEELSALPTATPEVALARTLDIPRNSLLREWMELYWVSLDRSSFLDWASTFDIDLDTLSLKGDTLHASTLKDGVLTTRTFTQQDDSLWWKVAFPPLSIARKIDPAGLGLPSVGGKSANPLCLIPRALVLAFYGYPEPENRMQAQVIIDELKASGFAPIASDAHTTSAVVAERNAQTADYQVLATALEQSIDTLRQTQPLQLDLARVRLRHGSWLTTLMHRGTTAMTAVVHNEAFLTLAEDATPFVTCRYSLKDRMFSFTRNDGSIIEHPQSLFDDGLPDDSLAELMNAAEKLGCVIASDEFFNLDQLLECYGFEIPATLDAARDLITRLRQHKWPPLPYVSEHIQTRTPIKRYKRAFANVEDFRNIHLLLEVLAWNKEAGAEIDLDHLSAPDPESALGEKIVTGKERLLSFRDSSEFQRLLKANQLPADSPLLLTRSGHVGTPGKKKNWEDLTTQVEQNSTLKTKRDELRLLADKAGGALRTSGLVTLKQMMGFYEIPLPANARVAGIIAQWMKPYQLLPPGFTNHWYMLGSPGSGSPGLTAERRKLIIDASAAFLAHTCVALIDYLSEGVVPDLSATVLQAKADSLLSQILISPRAHQLGNRLLEKLHPEKWKRKEDIATNREYLLLTALILSLDPLAGQQPGKVIDQPLNDSFFWGESYKDVRRFIDGQFALHRIKQKTLATHLLLSGIAPEFLVRGIPASLAYMTAHSWVKLKQVVLFIENHAPGMTRLMTYNEIMTLSALPMIPHLQEFRSKKAPGSLVADWAIARGVIQRDSAQTDALYDAATLKAADNAFVLHGQRMFTHTELAFRAPFATPYTVALQDLRKVFPDALHLEERCLILLPKCRKESATPTAPDAAPTEKYSLVELHMAQKLTTEWSNWSSTLPQVQLSLLAPSFDQLTSVASGFLVQLKSRLERMKDAYVALIKESFCELPLQQRLDLETGPLEFFALHPVTAHPPGQSAADKQNPAAGLFAMIVSCQSELPRIYEIFIRERAVHLRQDINYSTLVSASAKTTSTSLPFDAETYLQGATARSPGTCRGQIKRIEIEQEQLAVGAYQQIPATFTSSRIQTIASTAVERLFAVQQASAMERANRAIELQEAEGIHQAWMAFFQSIQASTI
ncbi:hypothetical protein IAI51_11895 [Pseudomonas sp. N40(2020)]|uniref:hypothetical protein n=1 Tax=Pseudomonas sp. N40(2020) TaxID=2767798 RepID=UPI001656B030|nr:hypothetical protein [Pseudomonas sp. N40(2020)]MBC8997233.1 hypothetical protein [Pseudomonas sp. N40(2020)]